MVMTNGLMRVFWPSNAPRGPSSGVLVGWRNSELDIFVVAILQGVEVYWSMLLLSEIWLTVSKGTKGRQCVSGGNSVPEQPPPHRPDSRSMRRRAGSGAGSCESLCRSDLLQSHIHRYIS